MWKRLRVPSGRQRGSRKQESPRSVCASTRNASHIGAEQNHLWPVISYSAPGPPRAERAGARRVGAHVGAALLLGHRHAEERAGLLGRRAARAGRSGSTRCAAPTPRASSGCARSAGHDGVGHRDRTAVPGLDLRQHEEQRGARDVRARPRARATAARAARDATAEAHELVPGGMELDLVDAVPEAVVRAQHRRIRVGEPPPGEWRRRPRSTPRRCSRSRAQPAPSRSSASPSTRSVAKRS